MFWKFHLLNSSNINNLLDKKDVTLQQLMDEDDILQECRAVNPMLVNFLIQTENMKELIKLITVEPPHDVDEQVRFKYPNTACELLTSDVAQINDKLAGDEELVNRLYAFLEGDKPLNPLLASFFSKVMGLLITRKSQMIFEFLKSKSDFIERLLYHIGTSAVMDLLLRLITCIESSETRRNVIEWLSSEKIVEKLVDSLVVEEDEDIHCNAAQSLCDIVRLGREQYIHHHEASEPDLLLLAMEQEETVAKLLNKMFDSDKNESVLVNGLCVIHTLLEVRRQGTELSDHLSNGETDHLTSGVNNVVAAIIPRLKDFQDLLVNPPKQRYSSMPTSVGLLQPPLGNTRLQVAKLITALVGANVDEVNVELASLGTIQTLLDLCFKYEWNNFLHTQVEQCLLIILNNCPVEIKGEYKHPLLTQLFAENNLVQRVLAEWEKNEQQQKTEGGKRCGFMGHLTKMANYISALVEKSEAENIVKDQFNGLSQDIRDKWEIFVSGSLAEVNRKNSIELMRNHPSASSSEDDDGDFKNIPFPQDAAMQQAFSDYQLQQMTSNFIDQFGFNDEEFAEQDEKIDALFTSKIANINVEMQAHGINQIGTTLFEQACNERIRQFDSDNSDEEIWDERHFSSNKTSTPDHLERLELTSPCNCSDEGSRDSREDQKYPVRQELQHSEERVDIDQSKETWLADSSPLTQPAARDSSQGDKPADVTSTSSTVTALISVTTTELGEGWADFSNISTQSEKKQNCTGFTSIQSLTSQEQRSSLPPEMDAVDDSRRNLYECREIHKEDLEKEKTSSLEPDLMSENKPVIKEPNNLISGTPVVGNSHEPLIPGSTPILPHSVGLLVSELSPDTDSVFSSTVEPVNSLHTGALPAPLSTNIQSEGAASPAITEPVASSVPYFSVSDRLQDNTSLNASSGLIDDVDLVVTTCPINEESSDNRLLPSSASSSADEIPPALSAPPTADSLPALSLPSAVDILPSMPSPSSADSLPSMPSPSAADLPPALSAPSAADLAPAQSAPPASDSLPALSLPSAADLLPALPSLSAADELPSSLLTDLAIPGPDTTLTADQKTETEAKEAHELHDITVTVIENGPV